MAERKVELEKLKATVANEDLFVCADAARSDEQAANLTVQCRLKTV